MNFRNSRNESEDQSVGINGEVGSLQGNFPLTHQPSIYSLTFGELQSTVGSLGKEFGSMNMDELLRSIWSSEETQTMASNGPSGYLQKQGSLTLSQSLGHKTVDDIFKDITKDYPLAKDGVGSAAAGGGGGLDMLQKQQTLKEMTLEEFLVKAGVVKEDQYNNGGLIGNNTSVVTGLPQQSDQNSGLIGEISNQLPILTPISQSNTDGVRANKPQQTQQQQIFPKQSTDGCGSQFPLTSMNHLSHPRISSETTDQGLRNSLLRGIGTFGLGASHLNDANRSLANNMTVNGVVKNNRVLSSLSPTPYVFNGTLRGRRSHGSSEKVAERRQRRMIKNRESAARSRARKQAYTTELEAEIAKLKEENEELQKKQDKIMELQKILVAETIDMPWMRKKQCIRRTLTGPW